MADPRTRREAAWWGRPSAPQAATDDDTPHGSGSEAEDEVFVRVRGAARLTTAMFEGRWPATPETLASLGDLIDVAERWAMVAELEQ